VPRDTPQLVRYAQNLTIARAVMLIAAIAIVLTLAGAVAVRAIEPEKFGTVGDAAWWALQTVSTVGYGDVVPTSPSGRSVGAVLMLLGVAFVPAVTSIVVAVLITQLQARVGGRADRQDEIIERLERLEQAVRSAGER
jgi:voltage-gated potassium channel Kch